MTTQAPEKSGTWIKNKEVMTMKPCPIIQAECIGNDCKWWTGEESIHPDCVVFDILGELRQMKARLIFIDDALGRLPSPPE